MTPLWTSTRWGVTHALVGGPAGAEELVIVPGLGVSAYLRPAAYAFAAAGFRCWLVDPPGFGDSGDPAEPLGVRGIAEAMLDWLGERGLTEVGVLGHSSGTQAAALMAATAPDRVARLVLASPTLDPRHRTWPRTFGRWLADGTREPSSLLRTQVPEWRRAGTRRLARLLRSMRSDDLASTLNSVRCPVLVVRGGADPLCTPEWARRLADRPDRGVLELAGLPHAFPYQEPDALPEAVRSWMGAHSWA